MEKALDNLLRNAVSADTDKKPQNDDPEDDPVRAALLRALYMRLGRCFKLFLQRELMESQGQSNLKTQDELDRLMPELVELSTWIAGKPPRVPDDELRQVLNRWGTSAVQAGFDFADVNVQISKYQTLNRKAPGRPPTRRRLAVEALEMKLANPRLSWTALARKLCPSGREHNFQWRESLRQEVMALKKVLRKYEIPF